MVPLLLVQLLFGSVRFRRFDKSVVRPINIPLPLPLCLCSSVSQLSRAFLGPRLSSETLVSYSTVMCPFTAEGVFEVARFLLVTEYSFHYCFELLHVIDQSFQLRVR